MNENAVQQSYSLWRDFLTFEKRSSDQDYPGMKDLSSGVATSHMLGRCALYKKMKSNILTFIALIFGTGLNAQDSITVIRGNDTIRYENFDPQKSAVYGKGCGMIGEDPELRIQTEKFIADMDTSIFSKWLNDEKFEKQAYAVEGLCRIQFSGLDLSTYQKERIETIKKSSHKVWSCSGCSYWQQKLSTALIRYKLK